MKSRILFSIIFLFTVTIINAQLSLNNRGQISIGIPEDSSFLETDTISVMHIYGTPSTTNQKICFGSGQSNYVGLTGNNNMVIKTGNSLSFQCANKSILDYSTSQNSGAVMFNTKIITFGGQGMFSDSRMMTNVSIVGSTLQDLESLHAVKFDYNPFNRNISTQYTAKNYGLIAQAVESIYPDLVQTNNNGYKSVNYIGLIPILVNAINELSAEIDKLKSGTKNMKLIQPDNNDSNEPSFISIGTKTEVENNTIKYNIPKGINNSKLIVYDIAGNVVKQCDLDSVENGFIPIEDLHLTSGIYVFRLTINNEVVENKKVIIQ